jgi:hypothetical protein
VSLAEFRSGLRVRVAPRSEITATTASAAVRSTSGSCSTLRRRVAEPRWQQSWLARRPAGSSTTWSRSTARLQGSWEPVSDSLHAAAEQHLRSHATSAACLVRDTRRRRRPEHRSARQAAASAGRAGPADQRHPRGRRWPWQHEAVFKQMSAVNAGVKDARSHRAADSASASTVARSCSSTIHRFSKSQQGRLLPAVEDGS